MKPGDLLVYEPTAEMKRDRLALYLTRDMQHWDILSPVPPKTMMLVLAVHDEDEHRWTLVQTEGDIGWFACRHVDRDRNEIGGIRLLVSATDAWDAT